MRRIDVDLDVLADDCTSCRLPSLPAEVCLGPDPLGTWPGIFVRAQYRCGCGHSWGIGKRLSLTWGRSASTREGVR